MTVCFVVLNEMLTGIVASQVVAPARCYATALPGVTFRIVFLEPTRVALSLRARRRLAALRELWPDGDMTLVPYVGRLGRFSPALSLRAALLTGPRRRATVFHCRGPEATIQAARLARSGQSRLIFDARGATDHESVLRLRMMNTIDEIRIERARQLSLDSERLAVAQATAITAVGAPLAARYREWIGGDEKPIAVVPCCVERATFSSSARAEYRRRLALADDELLLVHMSTESQWEAFDDVLAFFRAVAARRPSRLLFLTTLAPDVVTGGLGPGDPLRRLVVVQRATETEVPGYLSAADVGLLLRKPHEAIRMSSPVKFAEYLGAGLAMVVSAGIGSTADIVDGCRLGVVLLHAHGPATLENASRQLLDLLQQEGPAIRGRAIETCEQYYVWNRYAPRVARLYGLPSTVRVEADSIGRAAGGR